MEVIQMIPKAYQISMEVAGNTAIWTRPDSGDSPCSYPAPTYSAVEGLFESVLWGPAVIMSAPSFRTYTFPPCCAECSDRNTALSTVPYMIRIYF